MLFEALWMKIFVKRSYYDVCAVIAVSPISVSPHSSSCIGLCSMCLTSHPKMLTTECVALKTVNGCEN